MKKPIVFLILLLCLVSGVYAEERSLKLLAVSETDEGYEGSAADLYLEIKPGNNRIFLDTYPLTKLDTQMSTRFAKSVACDFLDADCEKYDFFYRIRADSAIIGGPSAGAAIAALTVAALSNIELNEQYAITGTINSGGIVGPVGGLKAKIDAAADLKLKKVMIPKGERFAKSPLKEVSVGAITIVEEGENDTIDLVEYGKSKGIEVVEVTSLSDVIYEFSSIDLKKNIVELEISPLYTNTMEEIAKELCNKNSELKSKLAGREIPQNLVPDFEAAVNLTSQGLNALEKQKYYPAASFCFGSNIRYSELLFIFDNLTKEEVKEEIGKIREEIANFDSEIKENGYKTITDLQTYMIVKERLVEAEEQLNRTIEGIDDEKERAFYLAFAKERVYSARVWGKFFNKGGKEFKLDKGVVKESCVNKLAEAEENYRYVRLFLPTPLIGTQTELDRAKIDLEKGDYELCLFKASKAKAESNAVLSLTAIDERNEKIVLDEKLKIAREKIAEEQQKGVFPILAYSYYEYADVLKETDTYSALLYSEYALELSNLELYFKEEKTTVTEKSKPEQKKNVVIYIFVYGFLIGLIVGILIVYKKPLRGPISRASRGKKR